MNIQPTEAYTIYQCYMCYLDRENFALKTFKTGPQLNNHMRTQHGFVLEKRSQRFRKTDFVGNFRFLEYIPDDREVERRLCCPSCGYNTDMNNHVGLYLHYYQRKHVQQRGKAPAPDVIAPPQPVPAQPVPAQPVPAQPVPAQPVPAQPVPAQPVPAQPAQPQPPLPIAPPQADQAQQAPVLTDQEIIEETTRRGWYWDDIGFGQARRVWLDYARHGNPDFIRRRPDWNLWIVEQYIRINHPDDDINPDFMEEPEDVDQDQIHD